MTRNYINLGVILFFAFAPVFILAQTTSDPTPTPDSGGTIRETLPPEPTVEATPAPSASSVPSTVATSSPVPVATPRPVPATITPSPSSATPTVSATPTPSVETVIDYVIPAQTPPANNFDLIVMVSTAMLAVLGVLGFKFIKKKGQGNRTQAEPATERSRAVAAWPSSYDGQNQKDDSRCDSIKELLEQKKKELADMVKNWPEEKLKQMAIDRALSALKKDEDIKKVVDTAQDIQSKYNKLNGTIEMLRKRYDLCILSIPSVEKVPYNGTIIENSLNDKAILENIKITKTKQLEDWLLHNVSVNEDQIAKLGEYLNDGPWYMHFWQDNKDDVIIVFKDKSFKIKFSDKATWTDALNYGKSKGIPVEQFDFSIE